MLISLLAGLFSNDLAIDLGTANTLVYELAVGGIDLASDGVGEDTRGLW
jgi:hypothetical protein